MLNASDGFDHMVDFISHLSEEFVPMESFLNAKQDKTKCRNEV